MRVNVEDVRALRFADGEPVRSASAIVGVAGGWLVVQDDASHGCLLGTDGTTTRVRLLPPTGGHDRFSEAEGTKALKPDLEAACAVPGGALLLGSGSTPARMRAVLLRDDLTAEVRDLTATYAAVARALGITDDQLNLEGACLVDAAAGWLRWFHRGRPAAGLPTASVDVSLPDLDRLGVVRVHDLGSVEGVGLGITDAVTVPGGVLVSAAAEDAPDAYDDGPVVASALAFLPDDGPPEVAALPLVDGRVAKVEGLAVLERVPDGVRLLATVDADDPAEPSLLLTLSVVSSP